MLILLLHLLSPTDLQEHETQRAALYKAAASLVRAYANISEELEYAGYSGSDIARIKQLLEHNLNIREIIRRASGESLDLKAYEADIWRGIEPRERAIKKAIYDVLNDVD